MSDFQDRSPARTRTPGGSGAGDSVHQVVFRWDGNHGRQGTGMNAVAHSCSAERAEELGRELGPLLWVSGGAAASPRSVVRTLSRDGDVMLVQRWPTTDRGGRPSTVSHVLIGGPGTLKTRQCLGLASGGWGTQEAAERASGPQDEIECAALDKAARKRLPGMRERLPTVEHALILATAELLRDPSQRVSLLMEEEAPPGWPDRDAVPLVYLGLFLLFGPWLGREWTFATYDTVDTHPLRLTCVPRWESDTGGSGPLARLMGRRPANPRFEHRAAARLVDHLLAHPEESPGVPQLVDELGDGAAMAWAQRRARLQEILGAERATGPARPAVFAQHAATPAPAPGRDWDQAPASAPAREWDRASAPSAERDQAAASAPARDRDPASTPARDREQAPAPPRGREQASAPGREWDQAPGRDWDPASGPPAGREQAPVPARDRDQAPVPPRGREQASAPGREWDQAPATPPTWDQQQHLTHDQERPQVADEQHPFPQSAVVASSSVAPPRPLQTPAHGPAAPDAGSAVSDSEVRALHRDLREFQRGNPMHRSLLLARLRTLPDELLLHELRSGELPPASVGLLLDELGDPRRVAARGPAMRHELCAEALRNGLYVTPHGDGAEPLSRAAMAGRAADLFTWAVAPLARDERYLRDLQELLHTMTRDRHPTAGNWLWQSIIAPANGQVPDLPPVLWQQILRDVISRNDRAFAAPPSSQAPPVPTTSPEPSAATPQQPTFTARLSELMNKPGCVMGAGFGLIAVLITIVLIFI